jgi:hypothetical protein
MPDEVASRFAFFCEWVDEIEDNAAAIVDDDEAGRMLRNVAYAITHAFELGRGAGESPPIRDLHRRRIRARPGRQEGGRNGGGRAKRESAAEWHRAAWPIWWDACGQYPQDDPRRALRKTVAQDIESQLKVAYDLPVLKHILSQCTRWNRGNLSGAPLKDTDDT